MHPTYLRRKLTASQAEAALANDHVDRLLDTNRNQAVDIRVLQSTVAAREEALDAIHKAIAVRQRRIRNLVYTILFSTALGLVLLAFVMTFPARRGAVPDYAVSIPFVLGASFMALLTVYEPCRKKGKRQ